MANDKPTTPTRRRALAALAGIAAASAVPAIAAGDLDVDIKRLHDAIIAQEDEVARLNDLEEEAERPVYPPRPDVAGMFGITQEAYLEMLGAEYNARFEALPVKVQQRILKVERAWQAERDRIDDETGFTARKEAMEEASHTAMDRVTALRDELVETRARTPRGVLLKLRAAVAMELGRECLEEGGTIDYTAFVFISVIDDMEAIAGGDHAA